MPFIEEGLAITDKEYKLIVDFVYQQCGINLGDKKSELVKTRLMKRIKFHNFKSYQEYYEYVVNDKTGEELEAMLDAISTNVTSFFREKQHFDFLMTDVLPEILEMKRRARNNKIRIWSCASATGEEVYSILMTVSEYLKEIREWDIKVLGTDISGRAITVARKGIYDVERIKNVPPLFQDKYFDKLFLENTMYFKIKDYLKNMAFFGRLNLMNDTYPFRGKFDIIFCRNAMIYFNKETQDSLIQRLYNYIEDDGYLFIGHAESLIGVETKLRSAAPAVYQKAAVLKR